MESEVKSPRTSRVMFWIGWVLSGLIVIFMVGGGIVFALFKLDDIKKQTQLFGYPEDFALKLVLMEIIIGTIYLIPQTAVLGAILLTGFLGGAVATHVHAREGFIPAIVFGIIVWLGLYFRDARIRALLPIRTLPAKSHEEPKL